MQQIFLVIQMWQNVRLHKFDLTILSQLGVLLISVQSLLWLWSLVSSPFLTVGGLTLQVNDLFKKLKMQKYKNDGIQLGCLEPSKVM